MTCTRSKKTSPLRRLSAGLLLVLCALAAAPLARADARVDAATAYMKKTVDDVLAILNDPNLKGQPRIEKLEAIALERFDFPRMSLLVLGRNKNQLTPEQQQEFQEEFKRLLSNTYSKRLDRYTSQEKITLGESRLENNQDVTVKTTITGGGAGDGVRIDYRLRETPATGWQIIDVIPEGVSLVQNFRSQVQEIVTQKGVGQLIATLREKNASGKAAAAAP